MPSYFDENKAKQAIERLQYLKLPNDEGQIVNFKLEPWQLNPLSTFYGTIDSDLSLRQYRTQFWFLPCRAGKTTLGAAQALMHLLDPDAPNGFILVCGPSYKHTKRIFQYIDDFIGADKRLWKYLDPDKARNQSELTWVNLKTGSRLVCLSGKPDNVPGANVSTVLVDELHLFKNHDLWNFATNRLGSRKQPTWITMTTAGDSPDPQNLCYQQYDYACKVRGGTIKDPTFLPIIYDCKPNAPMTMESVEAANPSLGTLKNRREVETLLATAKNLKSQERAFRREQMNQWVSEKPLFFNLDKWQACGADFKEEDLYGCEAWGGYDQGGNFDLGAFVLLVKKDGIYYIVPKITIPRERMEERRKSDKVDYPYWEKDKHIIATEGLNAYYVDPETPKRLILEAQKNYNLRKVAIDNSQLQTQAVELIAKHKTPIYEITQKGWSCSLAMKEIDSMLANLEVRHNRNPAMEWCISNMLFVEGAWGDVRWSKGSPIDKIDGAVALVMATAAMMHDRIETLKNGEPRKVITSGKIFF